MPRQPKPFFRKQTQSWYCSLGGRQIPLGKTREAAFAKFHALMADRKALDDATFTLYDLSQSYLDWCQKNQAVGTYNLRKRYLDSFIDSVGKRLRPNNLKVHHVTTWIGTLSLGTTTQNDVIGYVQRMLNWAVEQGFMNTNPIAGMKKPRRKRRDVFYTDEQWAEIKRHATPPFDAFLDFLFHTGCRPIEARTMEARHINNDMVIFPADESKGGREPRVIYLNPEAKAIINRFISDRPEGPILLNARSKPWNKNSIKCRMDRISETVGFRCVAYAILHTWATNALTTGGVDPISAAHLMGHKDPTMISTVYSHIARNPNYLKQQAIKATRGSRSKADASKDDQTKDDEPSKKDDERPPKKG